MSIWGAAFGARAHWGPFRGVDRGSFSGPFPGQPGRAPCCGFPEASHPLDSPLSLQLSGCLRGLFEMASHTSKSFPGVMTPDFWANKQV